MSLVTGIFAVVTVGVAIGALLGAFVVEVVVTKVPDGCSMQGVNVVSVTGVRSEAKGSS